MLINILFFMHTYSVHAVKISNEEAKIENKSDKMNVIIYYPLTKYKILNINIKSKINEYIKEFNKGIKQSALPNQYYSLIILYDTYEYKNYISYIFRIENFMGGAHPSHRIYTVVYNKDTNKIFTIDDLIKENTNALEIFKEESRNILKNNKRIRVASMLYEGTTSKKENFNNFVFSEYGIILFFPQYQVAPYSEGEFNVLIPYDKILNTE